MEYDNLQNLQQKFVSFPLQKLVRYSVVFLKLTVAELTPNIALYIRKFFLISYFKKTLKDLFEVNMDLFFRIASYLSIAQKVQK